MAQLAPVPGKRESPLDQRIRRAAANAVQPTTGTMRSYARTTRAEKAAMCMHGGVSEDEFVKMRGARRNTVDTGALLPSIQVNIRAGKFRRPKPMACAI
jgi:hypothetical protein